MSPFSQPVMRPCLTIVDSGSPLTISVFTAVICFTVISKSTKHVPLRTLYTTVPALTQSELMTASPEYASTIPWSDKLVLNTVIKMQKNEFCLNFYTAVLNTNLTTLYTTRWANNVDKITVGPGTVVTTEIAVPTISGYTPIGAIGFSTKQGLSVYQCSVDGQGKVAKVYVYNGTSTTVINEIGQAGVHILYLRNFTK